MKFIHFCALPSLMLLAQVAVAGRPTPLPIVQVSVIDLPLDIGGTVAIAAVSLVIGAQLIKRKK